MGEHVHRWIAVARGRQWCALCGVDQPDTVAEKAGPVVLTVEERKAIDGIKRHPPGYTGQANAVADAAVRLSEKATDLESALAASRDLLNDIDIILCGPVVVGNAKDFDGKPLAERVARLAESEDAQRTRADAAEAGAAAMRAALESLVVAEDKDECFGMGSYGDAVRAALASNAGRAIAERVAALEAVVAALPRCSDYRELAADDPRRQEIVIGNPEGEPIRRRREKCLSVATRVEPFYGVTLYCDKCKSPSGAKDLPYAAALRALSAPVADLTAASTGETQ